MVQERLGWILHSDNETSRINEILCKMIVHDLHVLIQEHSRNGFVPDFEAAADRLANTPKVHVTQRRLPQEVLDRYRALPRNKA